MTMNRRIVIKIGSSSLTKQNGELDRKQIEYVANELVQLRHEGYVVLLVTSGSVAAGFKHIGYESRPKLLHEKQAAASVGQALLMRAYSEAFIKHQCKVAQLLLTRSNFSIRNQANNAMKTIEELLRLQIIPIINENDTVSVDELKFGDNDYLSALVANLVKASQLLIFTDTDGLYTDDPRTNPEAKRIDRVEKIDESIARLAGASGSSVGTGGMRSKIEAARIAVRGGIPVFVGRATEPGDMLNAVSGRGKGTYFDSELQKMPIKKQWVGFHSIPKGRVTIDSGAQEALLSLGKSLLPAGIIDVSGDFHPGDIIEVVNMDGQLVGKGVTNYTSWQIQATAGMTTQEIQKRKIEVQRIEVIHRDEWVSLYDH